MAASNHPVLARKHSRAKLYPDTFIDPQTGARLHKSFTLRRLDGPSEPQTPVDQHDGIPLPAADGMGLGIFKSRRTWSEKAREWFHYVWLRLRAVATSDTGKGMFKCALAYLLGSMATFVPFLSNLLGRTDSKHLVATITVYFHPARSLGSMLDALLLAAAAFVYTAVLSCISMGISVFFANVDLITLGHAIVLLFFVGGGLGLVAWFKLQRNDPLVNIACSLTSLSLITILTKEGSVQAGDFSFLKIWQILKMIITGVIATMVVSLCVFPISARHKLKQNMVDVTDSLADMVALITSSFLSGDEAELEDEHFTSVSERHKKNFGDLAQNMKEAKYEHYFLGSERQAKIEARLAQCIQHITQSVGGLRSAASMQFVIVNYPETFTIQTSTAPSPSLTRNNTTFSAYNDSAFSTITPSATFTSEVDSNGRPLPSRDAPLSKASAIFDLFIEHLGPSMRGLAYTMKEILDDLPYDPQADYAVTVNPRFRVSLDRALDLYKDSRKDALQAVYDEKGLDRKRPLSVEADWEEAAACCGHFSFSLLEVAEEMKTYLDILDDMQLELSEAPRGRTYTWLKFWRSREGRINLDNIPPHLNTSTDHGEGAAEINLHFKPPIRKDTMVDTNTLTDQPHPLWQRRLQEKLYSALSFLRSDDKKFAIKVGFGAVIYAMPSFLSETRPIYSHWRGEWGLLSYMLVCSMTIGASNTTGYSRILGTCLGALLAIAAWSISNDSALALAFLGFLMAYWTSYIILGLHQGPMGRFIMLTYNLSALYAYSLSILDESPDEDSDEETSPRNPLILEIALHRVVAVIAGTIWGLIITRMVWPISARQKLKDGLALLWLRMGLIWKRDPLTTLLVSDHQSQHYSKYMNLREESSLQAYLIKLQGLVEASKGEFELRGPFPHKTYSTILRCCARMLDAFHAMNMGILKEEEIHNTNSNSGQVELLKATSKERMQLGSRISHLFSVLASSMKLEYPVASDALPNTEHARDRLLATMSAFRRSDGSNGGSERGSGRAQGDADGTQDGGNRAQNASGEGEPDDTGNSVDHPSKAKAQTADEDFGLLYTYALVTGQVGREIQGVLREIEVLFGTLDEEGLRLQ